MAADPPRKRQRLGALLRDLRAERGWTLAETATQLGYQSPATVSKIENGSQKITIQQLPHILEVYRVTDEALRDQLRQLVRTLTQPDWWQAYGEVIDPSLSDYLSEIETATALFVFNPVAVHGLLQTPDYARAVTTASRVWETDAQIGQFVAMRIAHQQATRNRSPALAIHAVLPEGALRQQVGGRDVQRAQLQHLSGLAAQDPNITLQILPYNAGAHAGMDGGFMIMTYARRSVVRVESMRASLQLTDPDHVELYRTTSAILSEEALPAEQTPQVLATLIDQLDEIDRDQI